MNIARSSQGPGKDKEMKRWSAGMNSSSDWGGHDGGLWVGWKTCVEERLLSDALNAGRDLFEHALKHLVC